MNGRAAWADGTSHAFGAALSGGYVTLHSISGGSPVSVSVRN
ncbi:MAG TPA: hypothetical protein VGG75_30125 [Trebonia sp.]